MKAAAPRTGTRAADPGNGIWGVYRAPQPRMAARPPAVPAARAQAGQADRRAAAEEPVSAGGSEARPCCWWPICGGLGGCARGDAAHSATSPPTPISHSRVAVKK